MSAPIIVGSRVHRQSEFGWLVQLIGSRASIIPLGIEGSKSDDGTKILYINHFISDLGFSKSEEWDRIEGLRAVPSLAPSFAG